MEVCGAILCNWIMASKNSKKENQPMTENIEYKMCIEKKRIILSQDK